MSKEEAISMLKSIQVYTEDLTTEEDHMTADLILCDLLRSLDCGEVADEFVKVEKWYG
jgi:hypothetical protein